MALALPTISPEEYVQCISAVYAEKGDPLTAEGQSRYMKERFPYYGLKAPAWTAILTALFARHGLYQPPQLYEFVQLCFDEEYREMHYAGLQMLEKRAKKLPADALDFFETLILTNSWWDTVDWINKLIGIHFKRYPDLQHPTAEKWIATDNLWLQRLAIIHQLTFREKTDWELMQRLILRRADSSEFFVQKAAGWALRQYSKTNGPVVISFIESHHDRLAPLTIREGIKWLKANNLY